jgi:uncharacterized membrane protein YccC
MRIARGKLMNRMKGMYRDLSHLCLAVVRDLVSMPAPGPRMIFEVESILSVLLAITLAHMMGAKNVHWAAVSGFMVMRSHVADSLERGSLRIAGTAVGATLAWLLADHVARTDVVTSVALACVGVVTLYGALLSRKSYAWVFAGLTFAMVTVDGLQHPHEAIHAFAVSRIIEVFAGTSGCVLISAISAVTLRRSGYAGRQASRRPAPVPRQPLWDQAALSHAVQGALALAMIPWVWTWFGIHSLPQSSITIMAVMAVPGANLLSHIHPTTVKIVHRFAGCLAGAALATAILLLAHASPYFVTLGLCIGIAIGRHIETGDAAIGYMGTQFALAFLIVLVPDTYSWIDVGPGFNRFFGIVFGIAMLEPVRVMFHHVLRSRAALSRP